MIKMKIINKNVIIYRKFNKWKLQKNLQLKTKKRNKIQTKMINNQILKKK